MVADKTPKLVFMCVYSLMKKQYHEPTVDNLLYWKRMNWNVEMYSTSYFKFFRTSVSRWALNLAAKFVLPALTSPACNNSFQNGPSWFL